MSRFLICRATCLTAVLAAFACHATRAANAAESAAEKQQSLIAILASPDSSPGEKAITCKHLARCGDAQAVPALAALLADEKLAAWARIALEAIPDPAADQALRAAAAKLEGRLLVGVINSIGMRRDAQAVDALAQKLGASDAEVAASAAIALGRVGGPAATAALERFLGDAALANAPRGVQLAAAEGCLSCAERLEQAGDAAAAVHLFEAVSKASVPAQQARQATRGLILARKVDGIPLLIDLLNADDRDRFHLGLRVARELPGRAATDALVAEMQKLGPERRALLVLALMDRQDRPPISLLVQAAAQGPKDVRITAIRAMRQQGDVSCVPTLLTIATGDDADLAAAASETLQEIPGDAVTAELATRLASASGATRLLLIELAGWRGIAATVPELIKAADDADAATRAAAFKSLGDTLDFAGLSWLVDRTVGATNADDQAMAGAALKAAAGRMPDRDATAAKLDGAMAQATGAAKVKLLEALGAVGGGRALAVVSEAAKSTDATVQGAAAQQLGDWMTPDAAPALLQMARTASDGGLKVRALRGYLRIARQFVVPDDERLAMYQAAMAAAQRNDERRLALDVLIRIPSPQTLAEATSRLGDAALRDAAAQAAVGIAAKLAASQPRAVAEAMQKVLDAGVKDQLRGRAQELRDQAQRAVP